MTKYQADHFSSGGIVLPPPGTVELISQDTSQQFDPEPAAVALMPVPSDDPNDPLNWSRFRKCYHFGLLMAMTMVIFSVLSTQPVFWTQMLEELDITQEDLDNAQAFQLIGLAVGCVFFIPVAKKYGRRPIYIVSTALVTGAAWWSAFMRTSNEIILTNVIMGLAGATNETAVQMSVGIPLTASLEQSYGIPQGDHPYAARCMFHRLIC
ncbi:hypothetical protein XA68_14148 [Ophiocordyceps unilateralis]|uniref:Major facilitator superfamily (MFS) profile domain-containing protein n=1 Tax=Ophiocordyceps unilateralis TaxID=268505 RepID=A0A2A9PB27_OPHUN|nr:hypothetical protein XA68_14148 [Ophiocordyceps unilateralis]